MSSTMKELKASESIKWLERFLVDLFNGYFRSLSLSHEKQKYYNLKLDFSACRTACEPNGAS